MATINLDEIINDDIGQLTWVAVPAFSNKWTSTAQVAKFAGGSMAVMKGAFTSAVNSNDDPVGVFPAGYRGSFSMAVSAQLSNVLETIDLGTDNTVFGVTPTANTGDKIFVDIVYPIAP